MEMLIIDGILLIVTTLIAVYIYNYTHEDYYLIGATGLFGNALYTIYGIIIGIQNIWLIAKWTTMTADMIWIGIFIIFVVMSWIGALKLIYDIYKSDNLLLTIIPLLTLATGMISCFILNHMFFQYTWIVATIITVSGLIWVRQQDPCKYNPFKACDRDE